MVAYANMIRNFMHVAKQLNDRSEVSDVQMTIEDDRVKVTYQRYVVRKGIKSPAIVAFGTTKETCGLIVEERSISAQV